MSRLTRDQQFKNGFEDFMTSFCDQYYPNTDHWLLTNETLNKNKSLQVYKLEIPNKKILLYSIDSYIDDNGVRQPKEKVEVDQEIPNKEEFKYYFIGYYSNFVLKSNEKIVSYVSITNILIEENLSLTATIVVCYYKSYIPYPSKYQTLEQLKEQNKNLVKEISDLNIILEESRTVIEYRRAADIRLRNKMRKQQQQYNSKLYNSIHRMQLKIREFYSKEESKEDCPVCYEKINHEELMVPGCCHYICQDCYKKCEQCPICREDYVSPELI